MGAIREADEFTMFRCDESYRQCEQMRRCDEMKLHHHHHHHVPFRNTEPVQTNAGVLLAALASISIARVSASGVLWLSRADRRNLVCQTDTELVGP